MSHMRPRLLVGIALTLLATVARAEPAGAPPDAAWSEASNGLRARLSMRRTSVNNGTGIVTTYLELGNVSEVRNPMLVGSQDLRFTVTDADGHDVPGSAGMFDGVSVGPLDLVLPYDSALRFQIGPQGWGVPGDQAALLDLGPRYGWVLPKDGKRYFLEAVMEVPSVKDDRSARGIRWHGRLELPRVPIPTEPEPVDPATLGPLIDDLGAKMFVPDSRVSEPAVRQLSLIDDPRVIPWYVKAIKTDLYERKFNALDRLSRLAGDDALAGLKIGMATRGQDIGNCSTPAVAASLAENIRHSAALGLTRSPHREAKALLWTMEEDPATAVRITVVQAAGRVDTPESLALLERRAHDSDATVRGEAARLLKAREGDTRK